MGAHKSGIVSREESVWKLGESFKCVVELGRARRLLRGGFFFFIFKKIKISKIYVRFGKFQKYTPVALWGGDRAQM
jgi:hypothetical protein